METTKSFLNLTRGFDSDRFSRQVIKHYVRACNHIPYIPCEVVNAIKHLSDTGICMYCLINIVPCIADQSSIQNIQCKNCL
jgi:hypothetical protein